jgi:glutathione peroxidase
MIWASIIGAIRRAFAGSASPLEGSIFDTTVQNNAGEDVPFSKFKGKKILIVNTASKCGYTPQLEQLQTLHETYQEKLHVLGFPSNDFWQEKGTDEDIASFCQVNYGVSFPIFRKLNVTGRDMHPLYRVLFAMSGRVPQWNFCKYLLDENGNFIQFYTSKVNPLSRKITSRIK